MEEIKKDCFAYKETSGIPYCNALKEMECKDCPFYKEKSEVKNNIFYPESFKSHHEYIQAIDKYTMKYGRGHLEDFEED